MRRADLTARLGFGSFDVLIVGGGIVGAGIAVDAALRGLKVALIEQGDFASGTSSKTSKLIHGGLRYLERGHVGLVSESLRERRILRRIAPTLVQPLPLLLPVYRGDARPPWKIRAGLTLYSLLALGDPLRAHQFLSVAGATERAPGLRSDGLRAAGLYTDCQMDDARLCLATILRAIGHGAVCCNYVRLRAFMKTGGLVCGGIAEDVLDGCSYEIHATAVVNATGPWGDGLRRLSQVDAAPRLAPTKGVHVVLPARVQHALFAQARSDGRLVFLLPWGTLTLVGTTESPVGDSLEHLRATGAEVSYLLDVVNQVLPEACVRETDVLGTFAGARPLLAFSGSATAASREHRIEEDSSGLVSVMGGKYTTYRRMAQQTVDLLFRRFQWSWRPCHTDQGRLLGVLRETPGWVDGARSNDPALVSRLAARYGDRATQVLALLAADRTLTQPICPHHPETAAEVAHAIQEELACSVTDVLVRRTRIAFSPCQGLDGLATIQDVFQRYGGLTPVLIEQQVDAYRCWLAESLAFRTR